MSHKREQCQSNTPSLATVSLASNNAYTSVSAGPQLTANRQVQLTCWKTPPHAILLITSFYLYNPQGVNVHHRAAVAAHTHAGPGERVGQ